MSALRGAASARPGQNARPWRAMRRGVAVLLTVAGLVAALATTLSTGTTEASWTDAEAARATFTAGRLEAPVAYDCTYTDGSFTPRWTPPAAPSVPPSGYRYRVIFDGALTAPRVVQNWTTAPANTFQFTYVQPPALLELGAYHFEVQAVRSGWQSPVSAGTAPVVTLVLIIGIGGCSWS